MINIKRADHVYVSIPPEKIHEAHEFYSKVMGLVAMHRPDVFTSAGYWYDMGGIELHLGTEKTVARSKKHFALEVSDLQAAREHLEAHDVEIEDPEVIPGRQRFMFTDPYGNLMELIEFDV
jgi:catechol 2,3-dioxygenase-like lactoylglutathione lyase family enzyme